jgi:tetrapyrrole methylase family protein/MazG family protein
MSDNGSAFGKILDDLRPEAQITVIGLGAGRLEDLSVGAWGALTHADRVLVDLESPTWIASLVGGELLTCSEVNGTERDAPDRPAIIAQRLLEWAGAGQSVVYARPGAANLAANDMHMLVEGAQSSGLLISVQGVQNWIESAYAALGRDPDEGVQIVDAGRLATDHHPRVEVGLALLCTGLDKQTLVTYVKTTLLKAYPRRHEVSLLRFGCAAPPVVQSLPLHEIDRCSELDHLTHLFVPPLVRGSSLSDLQELVAHLRAPEGCPWDREQTLASLRQDLLSECVEVLEAIDLEEGGRENGAHIAEELGDLLMVTLMIVQIAAEAGRFQMADVVHGIVSKLIRRHPHVFGEASVDGVDQVFANWDAIKAQEKAEKGITHGPLDGLPSELPALEKARRLQSKAVKAGLFDRSEVAGTSPHLKDLIERAGDSIGVGRLLWDLVAIAHDYEINLENALRSYTVRFRDRGARS